MPLRIPSAHEARILAAMPGPGQNWRVHPHRPNLTAPLLAALVLWLCCPPRALGFGLQSHWLAPARWDAGPRSFERGSASLERSLEGGLRYSLQGGSYEAFRDAFAWRDGPPPAELFAAAVDAAFTVWTATDPETGLFTCLSFTPDFATPVNPGVVDRVRLGAEIDLFAATAAVHWSAGSAVLQGESYFSDIGVAGTLVLTSGVVTPYSSAITGADITLNSNPQALWDLPTFQTVLTHEIGHALGLADVDVYAGPLGQFIDDNFDGASSDTARGTLNNSFALLIDPFDPSASVLDGTLALRTVADADPGFDTPGVDILMESLISASVIGRLGALAADDFAARQYLYPVVIPEPATLVVLLLAATHAIRGRRQVG